jgi:hypothetical protein
MSALGQKQTCRFETAMSAIPPKADVVTWPGATSPFGSVEFMIRDRTMNVD